MTNSLPPDLAAFVQASVASGAYASADDVFIAGIRALQKRADYEEHLRRELQIGLDELERGNYIEFNSKEEMDQYFQAQIKQVCERVEAERNCS